MLHEVVEGLKGGRYGIDGNCLRDDGGMAEAGPQNVVLVGHSGGGAIVSGYLQYHDVAAVVQAGWSNQGVDPQVLAPSGWVGNAGRQFVMESEYLFFFLDDQGRFNRNQCDAFAFYVPGVNSDIRQVFCDEPNIKRIAMPAGWLPSVPSIMAGNQVHISNVGSGVPVLIVWPEFDSVFRQEDRDAEDRYWHEHCGCDVTSWTVPDAGHPFQVHRSMPAFTDEVAPGPIPRGFDARRPSAVLGRSKKDHLDHGIIGDLLGSVRTDRCPRTRGGQAGRHDTYRRCRATAFAVHRPLTVAAASGKPVAASGQFEMATDTKRPELASGCPMGGEQGASGSAWCRRGLNLSQIAECADSAGS